MKKIRIIFVVMMLVLFGCSKRASDDEGKTKTEPTQTKVEKQTYLISFDLNGGTSSTQAPSKEIEVLDKSFFSFDIKKAKHAFKGWSYNGIIVFDEKGNLVNNVALQNNMTFKAEFIEAVTLTINYTVYDSKIDQLIANYDYLPNDLGDISKTNIYNYNTQVDLKANVNEGYIFTGWYVNNIALSNQTNYSYMMWDEDVTVEARFKTNDYNLKVYSNNSSLGKVMISDGVTQNWVNTQTMSMYYTEEVTIAAYTSGTARFLGWYDDNNKLVSPNAIYTFKMPNKVYNLEAKWDSFNITYNLDGGTNDSNNPTSYNSLMEDIQLYNPTKLGYTFIGWEYNGEVITKIKASNACHMVIKALWTTSAYTLTLTSESSEYGTITGAGTYDYKEDVTVVATPNTGYVFSGWYNGSSKVSSNSTYTFTMPYNNLTLEAKFGYASYTLTLNRNNTSAGAVSGSGSKLYKSEVTITATTNTGYTFDGWYNGESQLTDEASYTFTMPSENVTYTAKWTPLKYTITLDNQVEGLTISGVTSGQLYDYNSTITLTASNIPSGYTIKWIGKDGTSYIGYSYSFNVPSVNITITATAIIVPYIRSGNKIYFGYYPQTLETDSTIEANLNTLAGTLPTSSYSYNWTSYGYYISGSESNYMWYIDIDTNEDDRFDYRGVYFTKGRPRYMFEESLSSSNNGYHVNAVYWFKYEIIEWNILKEENGKAMLIANLILDSQDYSYVGEKVTGTFDHNGSYGYANNYKLSNIRKWLNDNFYNTAFLDYEKEIIQTTLVDNSANTTRSSNNSYACNNTNDKVFLLSYQEAANTNFFADDNARLTIGSDYAKAQGLNISSESFINGWWLRSPRPDTSRGVELVDNRNGHGGVGGDALTCETRLGVRPVLWINL